MNNCLVGAVVSPSEETIVKQFVKFFPTTVLWVFVEKEKKSFFKTVFGCYPNVEVTDFVKDEKTFYKLFLEFDRVLLLTENAEISRNCILRFIDFSYISCPGMTLFAPRLMGELAVHNPRPEGVPEKLWVETHAHGLFPTEKDEELFEKMFRQKDAKPGHLLIVAASIDKDWNVLPQVLPGLGPSGLRIYKQTGFGVKGERLYITTATHEFSMQLVDGKLIDDIFIKA
jgi:hypothetical protein